MNLLKFPVELAEHREIVYADPSLHPDFLMDTTYIKAYDRDVFIATVTKFWLSVEMFSDDEISRLAETNEDNSENDIAKFLRCLIQKGISSDTLKRKVFKVVIKKDSSTGLMFYDCDRLPENATTSEYLNICYCSSTALSLPIFNQDYVLFALGIGSVKFCLIIVTCIFRPHFNLIIFIHMIMKVYSKKANLEACRKRLREPEGDSNVKKGRISILNGYVRECIMTMSSTLKTLRPIILNLSDLQVNKTLKLQKRTTKLLTFYCDEKKFNSIVEYKFDSFQEKEESAEQSDLHKDGDKLEILFNLVPFSSRVLVGLYSDPDSVSHIILLLVCFISHEFLLLPIKNG
jgi:hypothetical protein